MKGSRNWESKNLLDVHVSSHLGVPIFWHCWRRGTKTQREELVGEMYKRQRISISLKVQLLVSVHEALLPVLVFALFSAPILTKLGCLFDLPY